MTIIPARNLMPEEITHLGNNLAQAICDDHNAMAQQRSLACLGEDDIDPGTAE